MVHRSVVVWLLLGATCLPIAVGQTMPAATQAAIDQDLAKTHFPYLVLHYTAKGYRVHMFVNGNDYASFASGEGSDTKAAPFVNGKNDVIIEVSRTAPADSKDEVAGRVSMQLAPRQEPKEGDPTIELGDLAIEQGYGQLKLTLEWSNNQPRAFSTRQQAWADAEHKKLVWQYTADGDFLAEEYAHEHEQSWREDGKLSKETTHENGKMLTSIAYKPDGTVAGEVKAGQGIDVTFDDDGHIESTVTIKDGQANGEQSEFFENGKPFQVFNCKDGKMQGTFKRYDETGKLRVIGQMKDDQPDGIWRKLDDDANFVAQGEYKDGELVKGENLYSPEPKE